MKKSTLKRLGIELIQHLLAVGVFIAVAGLLLNSYIAVETIDGTQVYKVFSMDSSQEFEESEIYHDLFRNAVSDITKLVVIKEQLETDDVFDPSKLIDVSAYAGKIEKDHISRVSAVYELDNLIKWGKYGIKYTDRTMSLSEFVNYFGNVLYPENFTFDEYGELIFDDFYRVGDEKGADSAQLQKYAGNQREDIPAQDETQEELPDHGKTQEELAELAQKLQEFTTSQLEDMVYAHIIAENLEEIRVNREDDGRMTVFMSMLNCRYAMADGKKQLSELVDNWTDFMMLQRSIVMSVNSLTANYQQYQLCDWAYRENNTNVRYMVRMMTEGGMCTYTNVPSLKGANDEEVTEYFSEFRRYLIYYPDGLVFMGNTVLSEEEIDEYISGYDYAYPDTTHIWLGVDTGYAVEGDAFYTASMIYNKIVPNVGMIMTAILLLSLAWLGLAAFLTITLEPAGALTRFDRIWTEVLAALVCGLGYIGYRGCEMILGVAATAGVVPTEMMGLQLTRLYRYSVFGIYGFFMSVAVGTIWYSLARRVRVGNLWSGSFTYWFFRGFGKAVRLVLRHRNSLISTLLPYNLFLLINLAGVWGIYTYRETRIAALLILTAAVLFDGIIGMLLFKKNAEQAEIVEGINRIRDGEVDFVLDLENLHGSSRELADAVNNIGEGIRKAVQTSMQDEQMKTDLITNVSHDIKTPLTSIINYVDLLKRLKIEDEPAKSYIHILDGKSQRLKQLTDDLVEASKISSGNIELEAEKLNLTELINQGIGEFSEKMEERELQIVFTQSDTPAYILADSRRMWRVMENLFNNICKYALEGTRVYIDMDIAEGTIDVSVKNISRQQMNIRPEELTERFIRGDLARSTEGSGLGLSIAKSLVQVQGGAFQILLDGDLFKATMSFPEYQEETSHGT